MTRLTRLGLTALQIAERFGVTERTIYRDRKKVGINQPKPPMLTATEYADAARILEDGASVREAARTIGRHETTISKRFPNHAWTRQQISEHIKVTRAAKREGINL